MSLAQELDTAIDLYNEEQYDECIAHINRMYRDNVPLYSSLRYNILLACCLDDWHEAENRRYYAENCYANWCLFNPDDSYAGETQMFWTATETAEAEEEYAAEMAEAEEEQQAGSAEEEGVDNAEAEEKQQIDAAEAKEEEQDLAAAEQS
ncbi:unnamed protein product [Aureobasidium pullulans]|nr:unnamed protein product [Aureobasidium pullulans]